MKNENYAGIIIEESLEDVGVLKDVNIISTKIEEVTESHKTPWVKQWTMHDVEISTEDIESVARRVARALDSKHNWYADFKNSTHHYVVFRDKVFFVDQTSALQYNEVKKYGVSIGIPEYQLDFHPNVDEWNRVS